MESRDRLYRHPRRFPLVKDLRTNPCQPAAPARDIPLLALRAGKDSLAGAAGWQFPPRRSRLARRRDYWRLRSWTCFPSTIVTAREDVFGLLYFAGMATSFGASLGVAGVFAPTPILSPGRGAAGLVSMATLYSPGLRTPATV